MGKERHEKRESAFDKKGRDNLGKATNHVIGAVVGLNIAGAAANLLSGAGK